jgi:hypothetical protein
MGMTIAMLIKRVLKAISLLVCGIIVWSAITHGWGWLYAIGVHPYPASSSTPWTYQLLSGFVPALTVIGLATFIANFWHHINCHEPGCWHKGRHKIDGTPWCDIHQDKARPDVSDHDLLIAISAELTAIRELLSAS